MALYPLLFRPVVKPKVWGSETWALSGYGDDQSVVSNGFLEDNTIGEVLEIYMDELVGEHVYSRFGNTFPLLFKFIDAQDDLSIQVHPDDAQAAQLGMEGKAEMWYVTGATPEASLVMGFGCDTSEEEVRRRLEDDSIMEVLQVVPVRKGDVAYIPAGTVHALRRGTQVAEIQQTSDLTFRLYDYHRPGLDGRPRQLHIDESMAVLNFGRLEHPLADYKPQNGKAVKLVEDEHFVTSLLRLDRPVSLDYAKRDSFVVYMCTEGQAAVRCGGSAVQEVVVAAGQTLLVPASLPDITLLPTAGAAVLLEVTVP